MPRNWDTELALESRRPLETIACPLCGGKSFQTFRRAPDRFAAGNRCSFTIVRCDGCGFHFLNPRPEERDASRYYENAGYQPFVSARQSRGLWDRMYGLARRFMVVRKRRRIERFKRSGRVLDVGCGTGEFLVEMQRHGWRAAGLEPDAAAARFACETYGLQVVAGGVESLHAVAGPFDVITLWHVLEHLRQPVEALRNIGALLHPDGLLIVAVPNAGSVDAGFYGNYWVPLDAPRHLSHFTPQSMQSLVERCGMRIVDQLSMPIDAFYNCLMSEMLLSRIKNRGALLQGVFLLRGLLVAVVSALLSGNFHSRTQRNGSSVMYFIQKGEG